MSVFENFRNSKEPTRESPLLAADEHELCHCHSVTSPVVGSPRRELHLGARPRQRERHRARATRRHRRRRRHRRSDGRPGPRRSRRRRRRIAVPDERTILFAANMQCSSACQRLTVKRMHGVRPPYLVDLIPHVLRRDIAGVGWSHREARAAGDARTLSISCDAITNVTGGCPSTVLHSAIHRRIIISFPEYQIRQHEDERTCDGGGHHGRCCELCVRNNGTVARSNESIN